MGKGIKHRAVINKLAPEVALQGYSVSCCKVYERHRFLAFDSHKRTFMIQAQNLC